MMAIDITAGAALLAAVAAASAAAATSAVTVEASAGAPVETTSTFYWLMPGGSGSQSEAGFSWYTRVFSLWQEGHPVPGDFQMGMGGTWIYTVHPSPSGACCCNPGGGWANHSGCCASGGGCADEGKLYETIEGGPGYWCGELPTSRALFRMNSATNCYDYQIASPFGYFDEAKTPPCDKLGMAALSNQMVVPPNGIFVPNDGLLGVAYIKTPFGKVDPTDDSNLWTAVLDATNFAGPLSYYIPQHWTGRNAGYPYPPTTVKDMSNIERVQAGAGAFEWGQQHTYRDATGNYKLAQLSFPTIDGRTVFFMGGRNHTTAETQDALEAALGSGTLDVDLVMPGGTRMDCSRNSSHPAIYPVDGTAPKHHTKNLTVGTLHGSVEGEDCVWSMECADSLHQREGGGEATAGSKHQIGSCKMPRYIDSDMRPVAESQVSQALREQQFDSKKCGVNGLCGEAGQFDSLSSPNKGGCAETPGPASPALHCVRTGTPSWLAWRWYLFTEQPAIIRQQLTAAQREFMQGRVEKLHRMIGRGKSEWIKPRGATKEGIATVDPALLVTPPAGMEYGYVPVAMYEGVEKPPHCV